MDELKDLVGLAKEQGPVAAAWLALFGAVAWIAGHGAKAALRNVTSILQMNNELREHLAEQLRHATQGRDEADQANARLRADLDDSRRRMSQLEGRLQFAEERADRLEAELVMVNEENQRLRTHRT